METFERKVKVIFRMARGGVPVRALHLSNPGEIIAFLQPLVTGLSGVDGEAQLARISAFRAL
jgi:hypothetical protein